MYCTETEFKNSTFGKNIIAKIKRNYSVINRPVTDNYFTTAFLNAFSLQYNQSFSCYQDALNFWADARYESLVNEGLLAAGNDKYVKWLENNQSPIDQIADIFKSIPLILLAVLIISVVRK